MSAPRTKRQFAGAAADPAQRQITSFFAANRSSSASNEATTNSGSTQQPVLPSSVQSNLLSVGMRVRKSVPEGYKTGTMSAFKLWNDNTPMPAPSMTAAPAPTPARSAGRELLPFCGINRVGGLATQPEPLMNDIPGLDSVPELTMSQESTDSNASAAPSRKRFMDDEDEDDEDEAPQRWDGEFAPRGSVPVGQRNARVLAGQRARKSPLNPGQADDDFDDADFLVFRGNVDMDMSY